MSFMHAFKLLLVIYGQKSETILEEYVLHAVTKNIATDFRNDFH